MNVWLGRIMRHLSSGVAAANIDLAKSYEEAVRALNTLQSNAAYIEKAREQRNRQRFLSLPLTTQTASRVGIELSDLDKLSIIHVSGTKGKGSTCAFCESILRAHGYKTGFFSSPHLVEVRERIRINGKPIGREKFSSYFWDCYNKLENTKEQFEGNMPPYFRFMTIMAFHVFLQEQVDVAIMEVGIGGTYDCTNIIRHPVVCGVSSLGMDHMAVLGDTQDKIAWQKAGIFKPGVPAVTVPQPHNSLQVLVNRSTEIGCPLYLSPNLESYKWQGRDIKLGIAGQIQYLNASLAVQLCQMWLKYKDDSIEERKQKFLNAEFEMNCIIPGEAFEITETMAEALKNCVWPGRTQIISRPGLTYYLDGAHTPKSIQQCSLWFQRAADEEKAALGDAKVVRVLLFNSTGDRKPESLLSHLLPCEFDAAVFCPNIAVLGVSNADQTNYTVTPRSVQDRCTTNKNMWLRLTSQTEELAELKIKGDTEEPVTKLPRTVSHPDSADNVAFNRLSEPVGGESVADSSQSSEAAKPEDNGIPTSELSGKKFKEDEVMTSLTFSCIQDALLWASQGRDPLLPQKAVLKSGVLEKLTDPSHIQVLCTGSLHLIGGILTLLQPDLND